MSIISNDLIPYKCFIATFNNLPNSIMKALSVLILLIIPEILLQAQEMENSAGVSAISIEQITKK